jgi:DNA-binding LacI/PurR family transcriptional regulator
VIKQNVLFAADNLSGIILCQYTDAAGLSSISNPHREAFRHGLDYLIEKGHRKIAISLARKKGKNSQVRIAAYKEALKKIGKDLRILDHSPQTAQSVCHPSSSIYEKGLSRQAASAPFPQPALPCKAVRSS